MLLGAAMGAGSKPQGVHVLPVTSASTLCAFLVAGACPPLENAPRIEVLAAGSDEVPGVYKNIHQVMESQKDLVTAIARFDPRMVLMCGDGSKAED